MSISPFPPEKMFACCAAAPNTDNNLPAFTRLAGTTIAFRYRATLYKFNVLECVDVDGKSQEAVCVQVTIGCKMCPAVLGCGVDGDLRFLPEVLNVLRCKEFWDVKVVWRLALPGREYSFFAGNVAR